MGTSGKALRRRADPPRRAQDPLTSFWIFGPFPLTAVAQTLEALRKSVSSRPTESPSNQDAFAERPAQDGIHATRNGDNHLVPKSDLPWTRERLPEKEAVAQG